MRATQGESFEVQLTPPVYDAPVTLAELSNIELVTHLRKKLDDRSWKPDEFIEAERRGKECLDSDPEIAKAFWDERDRQVASATEAFKAAFEPTRLALTKLAGKIPSLPHINPALLTDLPDLAGGHQKELIAVLERSETRLAAIEAHIKRDLVFWIQFAAVLAGAALAALALFK